MHLQIAAACDAAVAYSNRLCILGTFDTIQTRDFPVVRTQCSFVFQISWGKSEEGVHSVRVQFMDEDGKQTLDDIKSAIQVVVPAGCYFATTNHIINIQQLKFNRPGGYQAAISVDDRHLNHLHGPAVVTPSLVDYLCAFQSPFLRCSCHTHPSRERSTSCPHLSAKKSNGSTSAGTMPRTPPALACCSSAIRSPTDTMARSAPA